MDKAEAMVVLEEIREEEELRLNIDLDAANSDSRVKSMAMYYYGRRLTAIALALDALRSSR